MPRRTHRNVGLTRVLLVTLALAGATPASAARFAPRGAAAEAIALADAWRFGAAESALAARPWNGAADAALAPDETALEYARLLARAEAPGMCDTSWTWRPARVEAALERLHVDPVTRARAAIARARVEFRLGRWRDAAVLAHAALACMDARRVRADMLRYEARLLLVEATSVERLAEPRAELARADSLARVLGDAAAPWRARHLRVAANLAWLEGRLPDAVRTFAEAVKAADATVPVPEADACIALVLQGFLEGFTNAPLADRHKIEAATRAEATLGLADERALLVLGRSVANLRDPARLPAADAKFDEARRLLRARGFESLAGAWSLDYFHSRVCYGLGRQGRQRELLEHALEIARRWNGPDNIREMYSNIDLGIATYVALDTATVGRAIPYWRRAVEIGSRLPATFVNDPNVTRINMATALAGVGDACRSRDEYVAAWTSYSARDGETSRLCSLPAMMAARGFRACGDTTQVMTWYARALRPFEANDSGEREEVATIRESIALFEWFRADAAKACELASASARLRRQVIEETAPWLPDNDAVRFARGRSFIAGMLGTIALRESPPDPGRVQEAWQSLVQGRSLVLEAMLRRARVQRDTSSSAKSAAALRRELAAQVLAALRAPDTHEAQSRRDSLRALIRSQEMDVRAGASDAPVTLAQVSTRLGGDASLVSYSRFGLFDRRDAANVMWSPRDWYGAFVLRGGESVPVPIDLGRADTLDAAIAAYRKALLAGGDSPVARAAGARLRSLAWDPVVRALGGRAHVYVVPDGELQKLNWYTLPAERGGFLVDEPVVLHRLASERDLVAPATSPGEGVLAFGGMEYGAPPEAVPASALGTAARKRLLPSCRSFLDERFEALPASFGEARAVAAFGRRFARDTARVALLTGAAADEAAFKRLAPGRRVVHLATHAFFLGADCASGASADVLANNPLVFSGIALAGANAWREAPGQGAEDGLLTAEELAGMKLDGVEWLVLSGCESGLGQVQAWEGVFGLPRAARIAGARTLVMSLLPVDDEASRLFMQSLYDARFTRGEPTALAIRTASRKVLGWLRASKRSPDPRLWGAFVALGD